MILSDRPAFVQIDNNYIEDYKSDYILQLDARNLIVSVININKEVIKMDNEIKYTILADDGNNISYEKAIISKNETSRDKVEEYKARIEAIKAHIIEETKEIEMLEAEIIELENIVAIADEKKAQENQVVNQENVVENV